MTRATLTDDAVPQPALLELAASIVSAYVIRNAVTAAELPAFIAEIYANVAKISKGHVTPPVAEPQSPAVPVKKSITDDYIVCLEDGKKFKSLRRHLSSAYGLSPEHYRKKWGLPYDYPMVAPGYAVVRSKLAKKIGLGQKRNTPPKAKK